MGSGMGQGRVSYPYEVVEDAEIFLEAMRVIRYVEEVGLSSISLLGYSSESASTEIALPLPLFNGEYIEVQYMLKYRYIGHILYTTRSSILPGI